MTKAAYIILCRARPVTAEPVLPSGWLIQPAAEHRWRISPAPDTPGFDIDVQAMILQLGATPPRAVYTCVGWAAPLALLRVAVTTGRGTPGWISVWTSFSHLREDPSAGSIRAAWPNRAHPATPGAEVIALHEMLAGTRVSLHH